MKDGLWKDCRSWWKRHYSVTSSSVISTGRSLNGAAALARKVVVVAIMKAYDCHPRERTTLWFALTTLRPVERRLSDGRMRLECCTSPVRSHMTTFSVPGLAGKRERDLYCSGIDVHRLLVLGSISKATRLVNGRRRRMWGNNLQDSRKLTAQLVTDGG